VTKRLRQDTLDALRKKFLSVIDGSNNRNKWTIFIHASPLFDSYATSRDSFPPTEEGFLRSLSKSKYNDFCPMTIKSIQEYETIKIAAPNISRGKEDKDGP
jgi:hypothetical protein